MAQAPASLSRKGLLTYGFFAVPLSFAGLPLYIHAPDFYAVEMGVSLTLMGLILMGIRLFDAVQDPVIGWVLQKFSNRRSLIISLSAIFMALGFILLFHPPQAGVILWFTICLLITTTAFSFLTIGFNALGSLWTDDTNQKNRVTAWREGLGLVGLLIAASLPALISLENYAYGLAGLLIVSSLIFLRWLHDNKNILNARESTKTQNIFDWKCLFISDNIWFYATYMISMTASAIPAVLVLFFIRDHLQADSLTGLFLLLYFLSGAMAMPLWTYIARKTCKHAAWMLAMGMTVLTFIWAASLEAGDVWQYGLICLLSGMALGAELALPPSILSDHIDAQDKTSQTPLFFAALAFLSKAALALGSGIAFLILGWGAFVPAQENSESALQALVFSYAVLPCLIKILAIAVMGFWFYKKRKDTQHENFNLHHTHRRTHGTERM